MAIEKENSKDQALPVRERGSIKGLRYYKHIETNHIVYVNGFATHAKTGKSCVLYGNGYTGEILVRLEEDFLSEFKIIEKR